MRIIGFAAVALMLADCKGAEDRAQPQPPAGQSGFAAPTQTSIIRPELAPPDPTPTAWAPLTVVIGFPDGGREIAPTEVAKLERMIGSPQVAAGGNIRIGAHTDSSGSDTANLNVSRKRGEAVLDWLRQHGIPEDRIALVAFGEQNPIRPNARPDGTPHEAGRSANRRVEVMVMGTARPSPVPREPTLAEEIIDDQAN